MAAEAVPNTSPVRCAVAASIWLLGALTAIAFYGLPDELDPVGLVLVGVWATLHFVPVSLAVLEHTTPAAIAVATFVAVAALIVVPRAVDASIAGDESSTAALVHIWDPVLMAIPVGAVFGADWLLRTLRARARTGLKA